MAVALGTVALPRLSRSGRAVVAATVPIVGLSRIYVGAHLPLDVAGGAARNWELQLPDPISSGTGSASPQDVEDDQKFGVVVDPEGDQAVLAELAFPELELVPAGIDQPCVPGRIDQPR